MYIIYGKPTCSYCTKAKKLLERKGLEYTYVDISKDVQAQASLIFTGFKTVPVIFKDNDLIGGYEDLVSTL
jgi:glutaredoxin